MTAEIAILNRSAVALAADSAVTVGGGSGQPKIYNSVDKLFQLSTEQPVGIMVFGNAEFMGVPVETVIKKFRGSKYCIPQTHLKDYSTAFFDFLESDIFVPQEIAFQNIERIIAETFLAIKNRAFERYIGTATHAGSSKIDAHKFVLGEVASIAKNRIALLKKGMI